MQAIDVRPPSLPPQRGRLQARRVRTPRETSTPTPGESRPDSSCPHEASSTRHGGIPASAIVCPSNRSRSSSRGAAAQKAAQGAERTGQMQAEIEKLKAELEEQQQRTSIARYALDTAKYAERQQQLRHEARLEEERHRNRCAVKIQAAFRGARVRQALNAILDSRKARRFLGLPCIRTRLGCNLRDLQHATHYVQFTPAERNAAALRVQTWWRMTVTRRVATLLKFIHQCQQVYGVMDHAAYFSKRAMHTWLLKRRGAQEFVPAEVRRAAEIAAVQKYQQRANEVAKVVHIQRRWRLLSAKRRLREAFEAHIGATLTVYPEVCLDVWFPPMWPKERPFNLNGPGWDRLENLREEQQEQKEQEHELLQDEDDEIRIQGDNCKNVEVGDATRASTATPSTAIDTTAPSSRPDSITPTPGRPHSGSSASGGHRGVRMRSQESPYAQGFQQQELQAESSPRRPSSAPGAPLKRPSHSATAHNSRTCPSISPDAEERETTVTLSAFEPLILSAHKAGEAFDAALEHKHPGIRRLLRSDLQPFHSSSHTQTVRHRIGGHRACHWQRYLLGAGLEDSDGEVDFEVHDMYPSPALTAPPPDILLPEELRPEMLVARQLDMAGLSLASLPCEVSEDKARQAKRSKDLPSPRAPKLHAQHRVEARQKAIAGAEAAAAASSIPALLLDHPLLMNTKCQLTDGADEDGWGSDFVDGAMGFYGKTVPKLPKLKTRAESPHGPQPWDLALPRECCVPVC
eukprot:TRINITY_DN111647_c0_g1_i1.p1 TRINITY_DN111647_c0_g1~~TRINITY_DN111647_c0_g1_i1.p1  ORF type:complete len:746 (-),score=117.84 TRINITY_DN111647_c0_g1_i1:218-2455(-)